VSTVRKALLIGEMAFLYGVILSYIWIIFPLENQLLNLGGAFFILGVVTISSVYHQKSLREMGIRRDNFGRSLKVVGSFTAGGVFLLLVVGCLLGSIYFNWCFIPDLLWYLVWAFLQQYGFQTFFNLKFSELFPGKLQAAGATAVIFSTVHLPNPFLTPVTLAVGFFWCWSFLDQPNLFTLALSHALLATFARYTLPLALTGDLRVGPLYLLWR